jgi:hypothetical protein
VSFEEQERALFDLLFDNSLRDKFYNNKISSLADYELNPDELKDFSDIRPHALAMDAHMRTNLVLSQLARAYPITFSIVRSIKGDSDILTRLVDTQTMRSPSIERATKFGSRLRESLAGTKFDSTKEQKMIISILEAELGMVMTSNAIKRAVIDKGVMPDGNASIEQDWSILPIKLAAYVSAAVIPLPYEKLKSSLCPVADSELWRYLSRSPIPVSRVRAILRKEDPRLLVARAQINRLSRCEPSASHQTVELSEGFAPLFGYIDGSTSVDVLLIQIQQAGATDQILRGIKSGFLKLLETGMLEIVRQ